MLFEALTALQNLEPVAALRASRWVYPLVNTAHVLGIALLVGAIAPLDLRLLGLWRSVPLHLLARVLQPMAVAGLAVAVTAGLLMFAVGAIKYAAMPLFLAKLALIAAALVNAVLLRRHPDWVLARVPGLAAEPGPRLKAAAALSLALWLAVILCGRFLAYLA
ncbi:MAG: hypothetical protein ACM35H_03050 [Bacteroidota bacterium]|nr:DUF2214 domain-containing protein [Kiloniellaceae bacterium]